MRQTESIASIFILMYVDIVANVMGVLHELLSNLTKLNTHY